MKKDAHGLTLVEVIVTMAVSSLFFALASIVVVSLLTNYRTSEKANNMNQEIILVSKIITDTIDSNNIDGKELLLNDSVISYSGSDVSYNIISFDGSLKILSYKIFGKDSNTLELNYISSIEFLSLNGNLLQVKITNIEEKTKNFALKIVGGISNEEDNT